MQSEEDYQVDPKRYFPPVCPRCESASGFHAVDVKGESNTGCLLFMLGGILPYLLYSAENQGTKIECERCHLVFSPVRRNTTADYIFAAVVIAVILTLLGFLIFGLAGQ